MGCENEKNCIKRIFRLVLFPILVTISGFWCILYAFLETYPIYPQILILLIGTFMGGPYNLMSSVISAKLV